MTLLFQDGDFISHAGLPLAWKIECDAITTDEWRCLAKMIMDYQKGPFSRAEGIPRGGVPLGKALNEYGTGNPHACSLLQMMYIQREQVSRIYRRTL